MGGEDPSYHAATDRNLVSENGGWSQGETPVEADLDGMGDFVKNVGVLKDNLATHSWYFNEVSELPSKGLGVKRYDDGVAAMRILAANAAEFQSYFQMLKQAHLNIAMGGQDCIDAMGGKDNLNGITLNAVKFALDLPGAERPSGLPKQIGKTWQDAYSEQMAEQADPASGTETSKWTENPAMGPPPTPGMTTKTYTDQYGNTRVVMTSADGNTTSVTETSADGRTVTTTESVTSGGATTTTVTRQENLFTPKEKTTTSTSTSTTQTTGNTTTTTVTGSDGTPTSEHSVTNNPNGSTTTTDTNYNDKGKAEDDPSLTVGKQRPDPKMPESPVPDAMNSIR